ELDHAPTVGGIVERGKDLSADAEIGMAHVGRFGRFGETERNSPEIIGVHVKPHGGYRVPDGRANGMGRRTLWRELPPARNPAQPSARSSFRLNATGSRAG